MKIQVCLTVEVAFFITTPHLLCGRQLITVVVIIITINVVKALF